MKYYDEDKMREVREAFEKEVMRWPGVTAKQMMGCLCYFRGKKFFAFLVTKAIVLTKLSENDRMTLLEQMHGKAFEMAGRTAKTWIRVPLKTRQGVRMILPFVKKSYKSASRSNKKP